MLVREIMTAPALSVHADADLDSALRLLAERRIAALPIVDDAERVIGVVSELDLLRRAVEPDARAHPVPAGESGPLPKSVSEIMRSEPITTTEGADVFDLVEVFTSTKAKSLPVVRDGHLVGMVSRGDVIRALWRTDQDLHDALLSALHDYGQDHWRISVEHGVVEIAGVDGANEHDMALAIARSVLGVRRVHVRSS